MPISPSNSGKATNSASWSKAVCSGVTTTQCSVPAIIAVPSRLLPVPDSLSPIPLLPLGHPLGLLRGLLDRPHVHEGVFRQMVPLAVTDFLKAADRIFPPRNLGGFDR